MRKNSVVPFYFVSTLTDSVKQPLNIQNTNKPKNSVSLLPLKILFPSERIWTNERHEEDGPIRSKKEMKQYGKPEEDGPIRSKKERDQSEARRKWRL